ncbi:flagellar biosynthesis protein FlgJ [Buchnera aphidicola (Hyadaphis tataricae)]|uniref:Flagellar biosynthesis protein FlgJ n=1 Tax=Buchnera aphidicola (Hyadaphis tataricae) TaxID=1241859 RepID=A0A4D6XUV7_9GAMM|nr:rod-binding protein [Buchnera aphidicola]QCI21642.1 flagellar biosynthesis protein FlgJ [Buchnera aphidicola (Hyadaphis tataricae)]
MNDNLLLLNSSNHNVKFIDELKYHVRTNPKKYSLQTAREVESIFIQILLKSMRNALPKNSFLDNNQSLLYREIYDQAISKEISKKGIGLTEIILKQIEYKKNLT